MSKKIYAGVNDIARVSKKLYIGDADGKARKVKKMYIGDSDGKARQCYQRIFKWAKYTSYLLSQNVEYTEHLNGDPTAGVNIWPRGNVFVPNSGGSPIDSTPIFEDILHQHVYIRIGTGYTRDTTNNTDILTGVNDYTIMSKNEDGETYTGISINDIETDLIGKYIKREHYATGTNKIYKITGYREQPGITINEPTAIILYTTTYYEYVGIKYHYRYQYIEDVSSEDENAYTSSGFGADYDVLNNDNDIRTIYVPID